jgi:simple sugar transport system ATP-binding protein
MSPPPALEFDRIGKRFGGRAVLADVDLALRAGEIHALLGENGAGKTTLVRCALGLTAPDEGRLLVDGRAVAIPDPAAAAALGIGLVQQHFALAEGMTVAENLLLDRAGAPRLFARSTLAARARERLARHGFTLDPERRVAGLSVGEKQRVEIVKALEAGARVLILDEPTAVLAPSEVGALLERLRALARSGRAVLLISHKLDEVLTVADRVTVLRAGRVVLAAPRAEVDAARLTRALFGDAPDGAPAAPRAAATGSPVLTATGLAGPGFGPVDLEVRRGECVALFGVDGHGQGELLETLIGLRPARAGRVDRPARGVAFVSGDRHGSGLALDLPLAENLALRRELLPAATFGRAALAAAATPRLAEFAVQSDGPWQVARRLSGGNQQKVVLARELSISPSLVLAENPTRGLDARATAFVHARLLEVARDAAVLVATTDLDEAVALGDRLLVVHRGRLLVTERTRAAAAEALARAAAADLHARTEAPS